MSKSRKGKPVTYDQAMAELPAAEVALREQSADYSQAYEQAISELHRLYAIMAKERARSMLAHRRYDALRAVVDEEEPSSKRMVDSRLIDDPSVTAGLLEAVATGEVETKHVSSKNTPVNMVLLVGGLARVGTKSEAQILAAIRYSTLFDRAQIGGARAIDYAQVKVDTSGPQQDQITASQDDARRELEQAREAVGARGTSVLDTVVIGGASIRKLAAMLGYSESGKGRRRAEAELMATIDVLVEHFKLDPPAKTRIHRWSAGERLKLFDEGEQAA